MPTQAILQTIRGEEGLSFSAIAQRTNLHRVTVGDVCRILESRGQVRILWIKGCALVYVQEGKK